MGFRERVVFSVIQQPFILFMTTFTTTHWLHLFLAARSHNSGKHYWPLLYWHDPWKFMQCGMSMHTRFPGSDFNAECRIVLSSKRTLYTRRRRWNYRHDIVMMGTTEEQRNCGTTLYTETGHHQTLHRIMQMSDCGMVIANCYYIYRDRPTTTIGRQFHSTPCSSYARVRCHPSVPCPVLLAFLATAAEVPRGRKLRIFTVPWK